MNLQELILHVPGFLCRNDCDELIQYFHRNESRIFKEMSLNIDSEQRVNTNYSVVEVDPNCLQGNIIYNATDIIIKKWLEYLQGKANTLLLKKWLNYTHMYRILRYKEGEFIHPHTDSDLFLHGSITFNLNDDYEGGIFKFCNGRFGYELKRGDALIFPSNEFVIHEVTTITKGVRYSTNSFIGSIPENIRKKICSEFHRGRLYHH